MYDLWLLIYQLGELRLCKLLICPGLHDGLLLFTWDLLTIKIFSVFIKLPGVQRGAALSNFVCPSSRLSDDLDFGPGAGGNVDSFLIFPSGVGGCFLTDHHRLPVLRNSCHFLLLILTFVRLLKNLMDVWTD